jgi:CPA1 family monovalent cation:H+ antiporter
VETFFESIDFLINSLLFILIGLELRAIPRGEILSHLPAIAGAIAVVLIARAVVVYPLFFATRKVGPDTRPARWSHVLFWGGLRGSIPVALLVGLPHAPALDAHRVDLLVIGFGVVCFSLIVQGMTMRPLVLALRIGDKGEAA